MVTEILKGENKLIEYELADSAGVGIPFTGITDATVTLKDFTGNTKIYTKADSTIVEGSTPTSIEFEVTETDLDAMDLGLITANTEVKTLDSDFASTKAVQIRKDEILLINQ